MDDKPTQRLPLSLAGENNAQPPAALAVPEGAGLEEKVIAVLRSCYDPEIPIDIYELGLIYDVDVSPEGAVGIRMTLTSPACPVAGALPAEVESKVRRIPSVTSARVDLVWDPPWDKSMMSEAAQLQLGLFD